ncbi:MAG: zinc ABC transporter substrate-binding protein [Euryarchaeota archaeon]|nr:zinc ABC transporter substrate-binding protein [Euryarchaeota archaeon]MBV1729984.1 zinc ABC transporter substrate-binding protein [Methanobacterium sp.]MBV1755567.1 zinc ABC transporter substrate-binding protein [Methanobacterium sp.]
MEKRLKILFSVSLLILAISTVFIFTSMVSGPDESPEEDRIIVAASIMPQKEFIEKIGKEKVHVVIMVPSGADPHTYEIEPRTLQEVSQAPLYFEVGSGLEFELNYMDKIKSVNPDMKVINSSKGLEFIPNPEQGLDDDHGHVHAENEADPHVWTSPRNVKVMVENIYQELIKADPENKDFYQKNKDEYIFELEELDQKIVQEISTKENKKILVYHPAWGYFTRDYGLQQIAIEKEGKEPTPQSMANVIEQAKKNNIKIIFVSPQFSRDNADFIAEELDAEVVLIDPLSPDYLENMLIVLEAFKKS